MGQSVLIERHIAPHFHFLPILSRNQDAARLGALGRADDADESVIRNRIRVYNEQTAVVAKYYSAHGKYAAVNGVGTMDEVFDRICAIIDKLR